MRPVRALLTFVVVAAATAALADPPPAPESARKACRASAIALCAGEAMSGNRAAVRACLLKKIDKASPDCQAAVKDAREKMLAAKAAGAPAKP